MTVSRAERAAEAARLTSQGLNRKQVAERMGIGPSYASALICDPTGEADRARKRSYGGACLDCGARLNGHNGRSAGPARCGRCAGAFATRTFKRWFLESVAEWVGLFGSPPSATDWNPPLARSHGMPWKAERYAATGRAWPSVTGASRVFGSWNAALEAAGYPPPPPGVYRDGRHVRDVAVIAQQHAKVWTREAIVRSGRGWIDRYGVPPTTSGWMYADEGRPTANTVYGTFPTWAEFLAAIGWDETQAAA